MAELGLIGNAMSHRHAKRREIISRRDGHVVVWHSGKNDRAVGFWMDLTNAEAQALAAKLLRATTTTDYNDVQKF